MYTATFVDTDADRKMYNQTFAYRATESDLRPFAQEVNRFQGLGRYTIPPDYAFILGDTYCLSELAIHLLQRAKPSGGKSPRTTFKSRHECIAARQLVERNLAEATKLDGTNVGDIDLLYHYAKDSVQFLELEFRLTLTKSGRTAAKMDSMPFSIWRDAKLREFKEQYDAAKATMIRKALGTGFDGQMPNLLSLLPPSRQKTAIAALNGDRTHRDSISAVKISIRHAWSDGILMPIARSNNTLFLRIRQTLEPLLNTNQIEDRLDVTKKLLSEIDGDTTAAQHLKKAQALLEEAKSYLAYVELAARPIDIKAKLYIFQ